MSSSSASSSSTSSGETRGNALGNTSASHTTRPTLSSMRHDGVGHAHHGLNATHLNPLGGRHHMACHRGMSPWRHKDCVHVPLYSTFQNSLCQSSYIMPSNHVMSSPHVTNAKNIGTPSTTLTTIRLQNSRSIFLDMSRAMPVTQPSQTVRSLATLRQHMDESHHDLQLNRQVNRIATMVDLEENNANNHGLGVEISIAMVYQSQIMIFTFLDMVKMQMRYWRDLGKTS
ncbi:hypothetical protein PIB30_017376 [Stylosanthes scabra]|uniref:Uncharacterized protein n=1 Tax=Stylosanthes scabra TaxID=79078 RepID=A0ABU6V963_9FABA|nr:hypothetical protein [Stylosanthes scabra]